MIIDWFEITEEVAVTLPDPLAVYAASKSIAEKALWAFAKDHPELNIVTRKFHSRTAPSSLYFNVLGRLNCRSHSLSDAVHRTVRARTNHQTW